MGDRIANRHKENRFVSTRFKTVGRSVRTWRRRMNVHIQEISHLNIPLRGFLLVAKYIRDFGFFNSVVLGFSRGSHRIHLRYLSARPLTGTIGRRRWRRLTPIGKDRRNILGFSVSNDDWLNHNFQATAISPSRSASYRVRSIFSL